MLQMCCCGEEVGTPSGRVIQNMKKIALSAKMHCRKKKKDRSRQRIRLISDRNVELWKGEQAILLHQNILLRKGKSRWGSGIHFSSSVLFYIWIVPTFISTAWVKNGMQWSCKETLYTNVIEPQPETKKTSRAAKVNLFQSVCVSMSVSLCLCLFVCLGEGEKWVGVIGEEITLH